MDGKIGCFTLTPSLLLYVAAYHAALLFKNTDVTRLASVFFVIVMVSLSKLLDRSLKLYFVKTM